MYNCRNLISVVLIATIAVAFSSCKCENGDSRKAISEVDDDVRADDSAAKKLQKVQEIFYTIPSPMEMASLLKKAGTTYDASMLNDVSNVVKYTSSKRQALNLGIYGANLSYASIFNQNQESIIYLSCAKQLADKLGVTSAFDNETMDRIESNIENRDSLIDIISDSFYTLDAYLKENDRQNVSALVITGGWIEGLYLATQIAKNSKDVPQEIIQRVIDQKYSLSDLLELVNAYNDGGNLDSIIADLESLKVLYDQIDINREAGDVTTDESTGVTVIGGASTYSYTADDIAAITARVKEIRTSFIQ
ncbi:MAG: hypothetical protein EA392_06525 [Cryomorphaceae bacterium]|nr:MAG: hypothetical protein EA392_06525 [Cryomorphaceae bacterium]